MPWRYHGRASPDAGNSRAQGICDRCNFPYQLSQLKFQYEYRGLALVSTGFRVCPTCMDIPAEFKKAILLPADPVPVYQPRVSQAATQMNNFSPATNWDQLNTRWDDGISVWIS